MQELLGPVMQGHISSLQLTVSLGYDFTILSLSLDATCCQLGNPGPLTISETSTKAKRTNAAGPLANYAREHKFNVV